MSLDHSPDAPQNVTPTVPGCNPRVSVIAPLYNCEPYVAAAIDSVVAQTFEDWELVVTDDGSTDRSPEIVEEIARREPRVRLLRQENSGGPAAPRNRALAEATGELVCFLDPDDLFDPHRLETQVGVLDRFPDIGAVFSDMDVFSDDARLVDGIPVDGLSYLGRADWHARVAPFLEELEEELYRCSQDFYRFMSAQVTSVTVQTVMVRRDVLDRCEGPFNESLLLAEDIDLWFRLALETRLLYVDRPLAYYRQHESSIMANKEQQLRAFVIGHSRNLERARSILDPEALAHIRRKIAAVQVDLGYHFVTTGRYAEGRRWYRQALSDLPATRVARVWLKSWIRQGLARVGR
jgi:glycosyltransferase involved in cell wall biosynthesis